MRHLPLPSSKRFPAAVDRLGLNTIPTELPHGLEIYARSPDLDPAALPVDLKCGHFLVEEAWGLIRVLEGALRYSLEPPNTASLVVRSGETVVIEPNTLHHLECVEPGRFFIEFHLPVEKIRALGRNRNS